MMLMHLQAVPVRSITVMSRHSDAEMLSDAGRQILPSTGWQPSLHFYSAFNLVEIALLVSLTSPQLDIPWLAATCLKRLIEMEQAGLLQPKELPVEEMVARKTAYEALGDSNVVVTGEGAYVWLMRCLDC